MIVPRVLQLRDCQPKRTISVKITKILVIFPFGGHVHKLFCVSLILKTYFDRCGEQFWRKLSSVLQLAFREIKQ